MTTAVLSNISGSSCGRVRAAVAREAAGGAPLTVFVAGDSNTQYEPGVPRWHEVLRSSLPPGTWDEGFHFFGRPNTYDTRRQFGAGWGIDGFGQSGPAQNGVLTITSPSTEPFSYGPVTCSTFRVHFNRYLGGSFKTQIDDGPLSEAVSLAGEGDYGYVDVPAGGAGAHTLRLHALTANPLFTLIGWSTPAAPRHRLHGVGVFGQGSDGWTTTQSLDSIYKQLASDLTIALIGTNDYGFREITTAQTLANLSTWIDRAHAAGGDFLISVPAPSSNATPAENDPPWPPQDLRDGLYALAASKDCPLIDLATAMGSYVAARAAGFMSDAAHFTIAGHQDIAGQYRQALAAILPAGIGLGGRTITGFRHNGQTRTVLGIRRNGITTPF